MRTAIKVAMWSFSAILGISAASLLLGLLSDLQMKLQLLRP